MAQVLRDSASHRWAMDRVLEYLVSDDVARLAIAVLEHDDDRCAALTHVLLDGDAPCAALDAPACLIQAVAYNCWRAAELLSLRVQRQTHRVLDYWRAHHDAVPGVDTSLRRVMVAVTQSTFMFPRDVLTTVAARGDCEAMHAMLMHLAASGVSSRSFHAAKRDAFRAAAEARQLQVIDWFATHEYCANHCDDTSCRLSMWPLVDQLAGHGDLDALKKLHAREGHNAWNISTAITRAAENGHIAVVEWILDVTGRSVDPTLFERATRRGQVEVLAWVWARREMRDTWVNFLQAAARSGRMDVLHWLKQHLEDATWKRHEPSAFEAAGEASELEVVRFFHEERGLRLEASLLNKTMLGSTSVEFVKYVLERVDATDVDGTELVNTAAKHANLDVVTYLVVNCGYWSRTAFALAVNRGKGYLYTKDLSRGSASLEIGRFLYAHAKERASELRTTLEAQIDFSRTSILSTAADSDVVTARWLAESVPEVDTGETLAAWMMCSETKLPHSPVAQALILACLRARPMQCRRVKWLPLWAVNANCFAAFSMLADMGHLQAASPLIYKAMTNNLRDSRFMLKLLGVHNVPPPRMLSDILQWAARIGAERVLNVIDRRWSDAVRALDQTQLLATALQAVQHGHVGALQWLHDRELLDLRANAQEKDEPDESTAWQLLQKAVKHDRAECLRWLVETLDLSTSVLARALCDAAMQYSTSVVRWLTQRYAPSDLTLSAAEARVVRTCLQDSLRL